MNAHPSPPRLDSLRLMSLIFEYGDMSEVRDLFLEEFKSIESRAWIEVVP